MSTNFKVTRHQSWLSLKKIPKVLQLTFWTLLYVVNRCSLSGPGSNSGGRKNWAPTAPLPLDQNEWLAAHLKISLMPLCSQRITALALLLGHFMNTQINLISYHKMRIVPDSLRLTVWCKTSLNQAKDPSINSVPSKMDFFTIDFTTGVP